MLFILCVQFTEMPKKSIIRVKIKAILWDAIVLLISSVAAMPGKVTRLRVTPFFTYVWCAFGFQPRRPPKVTEHRQIKALFNGCRSNPCPTFRKVRSMYCQPSSASSLSPICVLMVNLTCVLSPSSSPLQVFPSISSPTLSYL